MSRDYNTRRPVRSRRKAPHQTLVIIVSFLLGYVTASFLDVDKLGRWLSSQLNTERQAKQAQVHVASQTPPKPKFEFYTLLANEKVLTPAATAPSSIPPAATKPVVAAKGSYVIQVASFRARPDADQLKGLLTLKGFDVRVEPVTQAQGNWFRVVIGPYSSRDLALKAQVSLAKTERLNGMVRAAG